MCSVQTDILSERNCLERVRGTASISKLHEVQYEDNDSSEINLLLLDFLCVNKCGFTNNVFHISNFHAFNQKFKFKSQGSIDCSCSQCSNLEGC